MKLLTQDGLRKELEQLCYLAGSYEDEDNDGWPIQLSLEDGELKKKIDNIMQLITDELEKATDAAVTRKTIEMNSDYRKIRSKVLANIEISRVTYPNADYTKGYNDAVEALWSGIDNLMPVGSVEQRNKSKEVV